MQNRRALSSLKNKLKSVRADIGAGKLDGAKAERPRLVSALDRAVKTGRIHRNAANLLIKDVRRDTAALLKDAAR